MMVFQHVMADDTTSVVMRISKAPQIPPAIGKSIQHGIAGGVIGVSKNKLIVAGGANFEDNLPWRGGTKSFHDEAYILSVNKKGEYGWSQPTQQLMEPVAYSACIAVPNGFVSIGGENINGPSKKSYYYTTRHNKLIIKSLQDLPEAITSAGAALIGNNVYVMGGLNAKGAVASCYVLDISMKKPLWKSVANLPLAFSHGVVVAQSDGNEICIYVVGGRFRTGEETTFLHSVYKYSPFHNKWEDVSTIHTGNGESFGLSAGTGVAYLNNYILLFGGDKGIVYNQTERINNKLASISNETERKALLEQKDKLLSEHPGLYRDVLLFNTISGKWTVIGELPGYVQVTTSAIWWNNKVFIPSGEIKPGIRTDEVLIIEFNSVK